MSEPMLRGDRIPVGAVLRLGRKNARTGAPELNDRWFIVSRHESAAKFGDRAGTVREPLPEFKSFNDRSEREGVTVFRGELVRAERENVFDYRRSAQQLPGKQWPNHPNRRAACECKDGEMATRLYGIGEDGEEDWREIDCPGRLCEFAQEDGRGFRPCKILARLYFAPRWKRDSDQPAPLMMWATRSWASAENVEGFLNYLQATAQEAGLERWSYMAIPFVLTVTMKTQPAKKRKFPVVTITPDGSLVDIFTSQRTQVEMAGGEVPLLVGASEPEEQDPEVVTADAEDITPRVPGQEGLF